MSVRNLFVMIGVFALALAVVAVVVVTDVTRAPEATGERVRVTVGEGAGFKTVLRDLTGAGLVERAWTFTFFARVLGDDRKIKRGTYEFATGTPPVEILRALVRGDVLSVRVTIPEGYTSWQIAASFGGAGVDSVAMFAATRDAESIDALRVPVPTLEGYLFPDTYHIPFGSSAADVVGQMLHQLQTAWTPEYTRRAEALGMTRHQVLTLASIVEAEARVGDERPRIAAVYHNRLARGMRLEADPTVAYAMGGYRGRLYYKDLAIESPYNTYRRAGLPPGPICSPGAASIRAALYPDSSEHALYFVAGGDGRHVFSETLRDHNRAVQAARRNRAAAEGNSR